MSFQFRAIGLFTIAFDVIPDGNILGVPVSLRLWSLKTEIINDPSLV